MKIGDLVRRTGHALSVQEWIENCAHVIIGPGIEHWDWEIYCTGDDRGPFTWFAMEAELELVNENR